MALPVTADFTSASDPLASPWTTMGLADLKATGGQCAAVLGNQDSAMYYSGETWPTDQYSKLVTAVLNTGLCDGGPSVRMNTTGGVNMYFVVAEATAGTYSVNKFSAGAFSNVADRTGGSLTATSVLELRAIGTGPTTLRVFLDGSQVGADITNTDTNLNSGAAGIFIYSNVVRFDTWEGGSLGAAQSQAPRSMYQFQM
jgi:hypothetical protein